METAKVDIRKLQLLNDRINQCLEALSQVRLTVHGLSHTAGQIPGQGLPSGVGGFGYPQAGIGLPQAAPFGAFGGPGCADLEPPDCPLGLALSCNACCGCEDLFVCIDDKTRLAHCDIYPAETTAAALDFLDALPRDPNGKLYKRRLRDPYWVGQQRAI